MMTRNVAAVLVGLVAVMGVNACAAKEQRTPAADVASLDTMSTPMALPTPVAPDTAPEPPAPAIATPTKVARSIAVRDPAPPVPRDTTPRQSPAIAPTPAKTAPEPAPTVAAAAPVAAPVAPPVATRGELTLQPGSRLWFDGTSNVKDFTCKSSTLAATVVTSGADAAPAIVAGSKSVTSVDFTLPVSSLDCDNGTMNGHMRKALEMEKHPRIAFTLSSYDLATGDAGVAVTFVGSLTIRGSAQPVTLLARATPGADGGLRLVGTHELDMTDYGVKPPSLMLNTMKVRPKVKVGFDLVLKD